MTMTHLPCGIQVILSRCLLAISDDVMFVERASPLNVSL